MLSRRERVGRTRGISVPATIGVSWAPACATGGGHSSSWFPRLSAPFGLILGSPQSRLCPFPTPAGTHCHPPRCGRPICASAASRQGSAGASAPGLGSHRQLLKIYFSCPDAARLGGSRGPAGSERGKARRLGGRQSSPGFFRQATKSSPLGGSGLKFSCEKEADFCSPPCEQSGCEQRAGGCGFVVANRSRRRCPLRKTTQASTPSQVLFSYPLGQKALGQKEKAPKRSGTRLNYKPAFLVGDAEGERGLRETDCRVPENRNCEPSLPLPAETSL